MAKKNPRPRGPQLELAGDLAVAFVNTARARKKNWQLGFTTYPELVAWAQQAEALPAMEAEILHQEASARPEDAQFVVEQAIEVRTALAELLDAMLRQQPLPADPLARFNQSLTEGLPAARMVPGSTGLTWGWGGDPRALERVLWPTLLASANFMATPQPPELRRCALPICGLLFVLQPGTHKRQWCESKVCGNRAKALRYYRRKGRKMRERKTWNIGLYYNRRPRDQQKL